MPAVKRKTQAIGVAAPQDAPANAVAGPSTGPQLSNAAAKPRRNLRGRRGSLQDLPSMPLDILFEVRVLVVMFGVTRIIYVVP